VAVGDFNGDGKPDLAVANYGSDTVSVLLGQGDGTFLPAVNYAAGGAPWSVAVGDFNGDGIADLAVANQGTPPSYSNGSVSVLLGKGDGTFLTAVSYAAGYQPVSVAVGDFNGDGKQDLAVANYGYYGNGQGVSVLLGNGDGTFLTAVNYPGGIQPSAVAVGDFNGDGKQDLAVANETNPGTVSVLLGHGDGTFLTAQSYAAGVYPQSVAVGDFNGDGILDLAVANFAYYGTVSVLLGKGDGTFLTAVTYPTAGKWPRSVAVGDFNGDGKQDLAVANQGDYYGNGQGVSVLLGNGNGTFQAPLAFGIDTHPTAVAVGDFNGDGKPDLAVASSSGVSVLLGKGDGTFQLAQILAGAGPRSVAVGDFNGDGKLDLAVTDYGDYDGNGQGVSVLLGKGDGTFLPALYYYVPYPHSVAVGDFNGDGKPDLAVANDYGGVSVLLGNGNGTFQTTNVSYVAGSYSSAVAVGDFNGDGHPDLAVANEGTYPSFTDGSVSILLNDANWPAGPGRASGGPSHPLVAQSLPPLAVLQLPSGQEQPLAAGALLSLPPSPGNRPVIEPPTPLALPGADPPQTALLPVLLAEGRPSALADPRAGPRARGAPWGALDHLFAELAANGLWDDRTDDGMPLLA
jgi:hypothetical protein